MFGQLDIAAAHQEARFNAERLEREAALLLRETERAEALGISDNRMQVKPIRLRMRLPLWLGLKVRPA